MENPERIKFNKRLHETAGVMKVMRGRAMTGGVRPSKEEEG